MAWPSGSAEPVASLAHVADYFTSQDSMRSWADPHSSWERMQDGWWHHSFLRGASEIAWEGARWNAGRGWPGPWLALHADPENENTGYRVTLMRPTPDGPVYASLLRGKRHELISYAVMLGCCYQVS